MRQSMSIVRLALALIVLTAGCARPSTQATVRSENASCFSTVQSRRKYVPSPTRRTMAAAIVASAHAVPAADNQLKL